MRFPKSVKVGSTVVKVYRTKHKSTASGFVYQVAWVIGGARKLQQFTDEAIALDEARLRAGQLASGRMDSASIGKPDRDELLAARQIIAGRGQLLPALREWAQAFDLTGGQIVTAAQAWKARTRGSIERITIRDLIARFLKEKKQLGFATEANHGSIFGAVRDKLGECQVAAVSAAMLSKYLAEIPHPTTRNTHRKRVVTLWRWAQSKNYLPRDTRTEAEQTERAREAAPEAGIVSATAFSKLLELVRAELPNDLGALVVAGFCGLRRSEVHGQAWEDIGMDRKHVRVTSAKKGTPARRLVPLSDAAIEWLMLCPVRKGPVCEGMAIDRIRKAGIAAKLALPDNCLRHSYISHYVAAIGNVPQAALDSGNSPQIIHRHYRELVTADEGKAWFEVRPCELAEVVNLRKSAS